jgi:RNA polymerase sigma-70 factor, ECF subfamily
MNGSSATWTINRAMVWFKKRETTTNKIETSASKHAAFEALVAKDWERFWRFAYRLTGDRDLAEDLLSETLIDAFSSFERYRGGNFDRLFFKMLTTNRIDMARKAKRQSAESLDTVFSESEGRDIRDTRETPEDHLVNPLYSEPVQKALDALPEEYRIAVLLADVEGYDYTEVAQILGVPIGTVRSRISRGREKLRMLLS